MKKPRRSDVQAPAPRASAPPKKKTKPGHSDSNLQLSTEFVQVSDDSGTEAMPRPKPSAKPTTQKTPVTIGVHRPGANGALKKAPTTSTVPPASASSSSSSDASHVSSSDSSSKDSDDEEAPAALQPSAEKQPTAPQSHAVEFRPALPYVPPKGFTAVPPPTNTSSRALRMFENLQGKQIWHITAPADVSMSELKEVALDIASKGEAILRQKGADYGFAPGGVDEEATRRVLIPGAAGYKAVSTPITQTLHLQQLPRLPELARRQADINTGSAAAASITASTTRAPRPQVKGLRMRFFPSGFGDQDPGIIGSSDSEGEAPSTVGHGVPSGVHAAQRPEKRKHDQVNGAEGGEVATKKHKKHRTPEEKKSRKERKRSKGSAKEKQ